MNARLVSFALATLVSLTLGALAADITADNLTVTRDATFQGGLTVAPAASGTAPTNGLVLYYSFSQSSQPVADDSGNSHTGGVSGASWVTEGTKGPSYYLDGNDYIDIRNPVFTNNTANWSMFCWVRFANMTNLPCRLLSMGNHQTTGQALFLYVENAARRLELDISNVGGPIASQSLTSNTWYFVGATCSNKTVQLYLDGSATGVPVIMAAMSYSNANLIQRIGGLFTGEVCGWLDDVRLYNRGLSAAEVAQIYASPGAAGTVRFTTGVQHVAPLGDLGMGSFTNRP